MQLPTAATHPKSAGGPSESSRPKPRPRYQAKAMDAGLGKGVSGAAGWSRCIKFVLIKTFSDCYLALQFPVVEPMQKSHARLRHLLLQLRLTLLSLQVAGKLLSYCSSSAISFILLLVL